MRKKKGSWQLPDKLWKEMEKILPKPKKRRGAGRPRVELRRVAEGIFYILRTGCQWKAAPSIYSSGSTLHLYFQDWVRRGIFKKLWKMGLTTYDRERGIEWDWQSLDGAMSKAPLGGEKNRPQPDRPRQIRDKEVVVDGRRGSAIES